MMRSILHMAAPVVTMAMIATATVPAEAGAVRDQLAAQLSQRLFPLFDAVGEDARHMRTLRADPALSAALQARVARRAACADAPLCLSLIHI